MSIIHFGNKLSFILRVKTVRHGMTDLSPSNFMASFLHPIAFLVFFPYGFWVPFVSSARAFLRQAFCLFSFGFLPSNFVLMLIVAVSPIELCRTLSHDQIELFCPYTVFTCPQAFGGFG